MNKRVKKLMVLGAVSAMVLGTVGNGALPINSTQAATSEVKKVDNKSTNNILTPSNHTLLMIDHQPQIAFATKWG
ncbi:hypothetical protein [Paludifilum halophilum]|uniref:Uncharacterized protein n=1 Tax=Paludifilum halophilum TaxID=1642702 RepID=A0A235BBC1_9BACL|nr:hypothetical protein [Paludifilum halophilum]OYD09591.1 hypothetical protein CHM34_00840 [Paludifilum halophilum]